jgi:hypothetical protein
MPDGAGKALRVGALTLLAAAISTRFPCAERQELGGEGTPDVRLELRLATDARQFRKGEVIPLDLLFTSRTPKRYLLDMARYDRSGRMNWEQFAVDPAEGTRDPLALYFASCGGFIGGGLTSFQFLSDNPTAIRLELNEWVRFDRPGKYRLSITSRRVSDLQASDSPHGVERPVKSNPIEFEIVVADPAWQLAKLAEIRNALNQAAPGDTPPSDSRGGALRALRYLGSEEAARELARRLRGDDSHEDWQCMFGLIGSPHHEAGLEEMEKLLDDPDFPVSALFMSTISILSLDPERPREVLRKQRQQMQQDYNRRLADAVTRKRGKARALSLDTWVNGLPQTGSPGLQQELVPQLIESFRHLPVDKQAQTLEYRWDLVKDPGWLPLLRAIASEYTDYPELNAWNAYQSLQLTGAALTRWYELDPEGARPAVLAEINRTKPRYDARVLGLLPDKTLIEAEQTLAEHLLVADDYQFEGNLASLLFRYAGDSVLPQVLRKLEDRVGKWACVPQNTALAYVLKVDPGAARPLIERAIAARGPQHNACRHSIFTDIGALVSSPVLEQLAISRLDDPDAEVANNAANFLGQYGTAESEAALWNRYEEWSRTWSGRASELRFVPGGENPRLWEANLGQSLAHALATGQAWLADENQLRRILSLAVGHNVRQEAESALKVWLNKPLQITSIAAKLPSFNVAQYNLASLEALKAKLAQFPRGTVFVWTGDEPAPSPEQERNWREASEFAEGRGLSIVRQPPR